VRPWIIIVELLLTLVERPFLSVATSEEKEEIYPCFLIGALAQKINRMWKTTGYGPAALRFILIYCPV
jgi:hypothetical protein